MASISIDTDHESRNTTELSDRLEAVFSRIFATPEGDAYFRGLINEQGELAIDHICKAPEVLLITPDEVAIKNAVFSSKSLRLGSVGTVRSAAVKPEQTTLILRDIAKSTPSGDILSVFNNAVAADGTPCPAPHSVRADMNDTWFVSFRSENEAKAALLAIKDCRFEGKPIRARLKTESALKSYYSGPGGHSVLAGGFSPHNLSPNGGASVAFFSAPPGAAAAGDAANPNPNPSMSGAATAAGPAFFSTYPVPPPLQPQQQQQGFPGQSFLQNQTQGQGQAQFRNQGYSNNNVHRNNNANGGSNQNNKFNRNQGGGFPQPAGQQNFAYNNNNSNNYQNKGYVNANNSSNYNRNPNSGGVGGGGYNNNNAGRGGNRAYPAHQQQHIQQGGMPLQFYAPMMQMAPPPPPPPPMPPLDHASSTTTISSEGSAIDGADDKKDAMTPIPGSVPVGSVPAAVGVTMLPPVGFIPYNMMNPSFFPGYGPGGIHMGAYDFNNFVAATGHMQHLGPGSPLNNPAYYAMMAQGMAQPQSPHSPAPPLPFGYVPGAATGILPGSTHSPQSYGGGGKQKNRNYNNSNVVNGHIIFQSGQGQGQAAGQGALQNAHPQQQQGMPPRQAQVPAGGPRSHMPTRAAADTTTTSPPAEDRSDHSAMAPAVFTERLRHHKDVSLTGAAGASGGAVVEGAKSEPSKQRRGNPDNGSFDAKGRRGDAANAGHNSSGNNNATSSSSSGANKDGSARRSGNKSDAQTGATDGRKKNVRKNADGTPFGNNGSSATPVVPKKIAAEFNMEADFPILIDSETGASAAPHAVKAAVFDYANAAKKASPDLAPLPDAEPPLPSATVAAPLAGAKAAKKATKKNTPALDGSAVVSHDAAGPAGSAVDTSPGKDMSIQSVADRSAAAAPVVVQPALTEVRPSETTAQPLLFGPGGAATAAAEQYSAEEARTVEHRPAVAAAAAAPVQAPPTVSSPAVSASKAPVPVVAASSPAQVAKKAVEVPVAALSVSDHVAWPAPPASAHKNSPAAPTAAAPATAAAAGEVKASPWGAKKSFAEALRHTNKA